MSRIASIILRLFKPRLRDAPEIEPHPRHTLGQQLTIDQPVRLRITADHRGEQEFCCHLYSTAKGASWFETPRL
jgi:hypothetical protein